MSILFDQLVRRRSSFDDAQPTESLDSIPSFALVLPAPPTRLLELPDLALEIIAKHLERRHGVAALHKLSSACKQLHSVAAPVLTEAFEVERRHLCSRLEPWHTSHCPRGSSAPLIEQLAWSRECREWCTKLLRSRRFRREECTSCSFGFVSVVPTISGGDLFHLPPGDKALGDDANLICCNPACRAANPPTERPRTADKPIHTKQPNCESSHGVETHGVDVDKENTFFGC